MTSTVQDTLLSEDDLRQELASARQTTNALLERVRSFVAFEHDEPWIYLDDTLRELRAAATTVHVLEQLGARAG